MKLMNRMTSATGAFLAIALAFSMAAHGASTVCVKDDNGLAVALIVAATSAVTVELVQNTYHLDQTPWNTNQSASLLKPGFTLLGGYTDATCATRDIDVGNTIITDTSSAPNDGFSILGDATIEGITFNLKNGLSISANQLGSKQLQNNSQITLRRNVFTKTTGADAEALSIFWSEDPTVGGTMRLVNNLVYGNSGGTVGNNVGAIYLQILAGNPTIELINNTVVDNSGGLSGVGVYNFGNAPIYAYNNIFYGNANKDLDVSAGNALVLVNNVIGTHSYPTPTQPPVGTITTDPQLDSFYKPIETPPSLVINTGVSTVIGGLPATDLPGNPRRIGSEPDRGAFESGINDSTALIVKNTNDSGPDSLRSAILSANALGTSSTISFAVGCPITIAPLTPLPEITAPIQFLGYSQAGSSTNDLVVGDDAALCVILDGSPHNIADGLMVSTSASEATHILIDGLAFSGFSHGAISLYGGSEHAIIGSRIGGFVGNISLDPVGNGIIVGPSVDYVTIGGDINDSVLRNIIGSAIQGGIVIDGPTDSADPAHDNVIIGNYIGAGWNMSGAGNFTNRGNGISGVAVGGYNNTVANNVIQFNVSQGIDVTGNAATNNTIALNSIGYLPTGLGEGSNGIGVMIENSASLNEVSSNYILHNEGAGVRVVSGLQNKIIYNDIYANAGFGIDLAAEGVTLNDNDSSPQPLEYANAGINFPVITAAIGGNGSGTITAQLTTLPGTYYIEVFASPACDASGYGQGDVWLGAVLLNIPSDTLVDGQGTGTLTFSIGGDLVTNPFLTATTTDTLLGNTSEFSKCFTYVNDTIFASGFEGTGP
jgi:trimeric autotransporter adhesin